MEPEANVKFFNKDGKELVRFELTENNVFKVTQHVCNTLEELMAKRMYKMKFEIWIHAKNIAQENANMDGLELGAIYARHAAELPND